MKRRHKRNKRVIKENPEKERSGKDWKTKEIRKRMRRKNRAVWGQEKSEKGRKEDIKGGKSQI